MCLFVTGIATLIHLYSIGYMHGDPKFTKFFVYLNLFVFSMLMLVLGDNMLITFLGWEGVGACSYFLISFWHESDANASAGKKAFVTNRIGDFGFMVAIFFTFQALGTINYAGHHRGCRRAWPPPRPRSSPSCSSSAPAASRPSCPLYVWLPDAMAGPTPVSALIHAATMVTGGVYLLARMNPVIAEASPWVPTLIAVVGALTALFAATIAVAQNDIKKVLAYSTVSQLGFMFLAIGSGAYVAAIFHMITHAFFKALLFLGSGSVIHGMEDEQDMRRMGGLRKKMPITAFTFIIGWLAIAGFPFFAGFFSKDEILLFAFDKSVVLWAIGMVAALLTGFYMTRQVIMVFFGEPRWDRPLEEAVPELDAEREAAGIHPGHGAGPTGEIHPHESPWTMTLPLRRARPARPRSAAGSTPPSGSGARPSSTGSSRSSSSVSTTSSAPRCSRSSWASAPPSGPRRHGARLVRVLPQEGRGEGQDRAQGAGQGLVLRLLDHRLHGRPGPQGVRRRRLVRQAHHRRRRQRRRQRGPGQLGPKGRVVQTGYVRNYALGLAFGALVIAVIVLTKAVV